MWWPYSIYPEKTYPIQLKVIADETNGQRNVNTSDLIKSLGLKASKDNIALMQQLISDQVPFEKNS